MRIARHAAVIAVTTLALATTAACSSDNGDNEVAGASSSTTSAAAEAGSTTADTDKQSVVKVEDAWIKATDKDMTGVFGMIVNNSDAEVHIVKASSTLTSRTELHETVADGDSMKMKEAADGFRIPAGGEFELKPGGNHVMLMDLTAPITTGQQVVITLELSDGTTVDFEATGRSFEGGNEDYQGGASDGKTEMKHDDHAGHGDHEGMDHGDMNHG